MLNSSPAFQKMKEHCIRKPIADPSIVWDRSVYDTFILCEDSLCDPNKVLFCSQFAGIIKPYRYGDFSERCRLISWEYNFERGEFWGGLVKSFADITLSNYDGRYSYFYNAPFYDCNDNEVSVKEGYNTNPGLPLKLRTGFRWKDDNCQTQEELITRFIGYSTDYPDITSSDGARSTARIHFEDAIAVIEDYPIPYDINISNLQVAAAIGQVLASINVTSYYYPDIGTRFVSFTAQAGEKVGDILKKLVFLELGYFYQNENGILIFETLDYLNNKNDSAPVKVLDTYNHIVDISQESWNDIKNIITVKKDNTTSYTAKSVGSISVYGASELTITNEYISDAAECEYLANKLLNLHSFGTRKRTITIIADPTLQVGDKITIKERVTKDKRTGCCKPIHQKTDYLITRINGSGQLPYIQKLVLNRIGIAKKCFVLCETQLCDLNHALCECS